MGKSKSILWVDQRKFSRYSLICGFSWTRKDRLPLRKYSNDFRVRWKNAFIPSWHQCYFSANGDSYVELLGMVSVGNVTFKPACVYLWVQFGSISFSISNNFDIFFLPYRNNRTAFTLEYLPDFGTFFSQSTQASVDINHDLVAGHFLLTNFIYFEINLHRFRSFSNN